MAPTSSPFEHLTTERGLTHQPGLDGLRGVAVIVIVLFHLGVGVLRGGYLSVTLFFTLSGVLIGTLVLDELVRTGGFSLRRFWLRRARRLLPAALVTLAVIGVARHVTTALADTSGADVAAAALDVANWHFVLADQSYADLFGGPSAVLHFWSLSIEEQFYLGGGIAVALLALARPRRPVLVIGTGAAVVAAGSFLLPFVTGFGVDRVYYGTDTRAGELMVGVAAAAVFASPRRRAAVVAAGPVLAALAAVAGAGLVALWLTQDPGTGGLTRGLLPLTTLAALLVVVGSLVPVGPVAALTRLAGLGWLGRISYSWYLVHWPVIVVANRLTDDRSLLRSAGLFVGTLALAQACTVVVERPVRLRRMPAPRLATAGVLVTATLVAGVTFDGRRSASAELLDRLTAAAASPLGAADGTVTGEGDAAPTRPRVALFGDSVGFSILLSLANSRVTPEFDRAPSETDIGCGVALSPWPPAEDPHRCDLPAERFFARARAGGVTDAVVIACGWELLTQPIPGRDDRTARTVGDPVLDDFIYTSFDHVATRLRAAGVRRVWWMRCPYMSRTVGIDGLPSELVASRDPARVDAFNAIVARLAAARDDVDVLPFADWVNERVDDATIRPDGTHFEYAVPTAAADAFVATLNAVLTEP